MPHLPACLIQHCLQVKPLLFHCFQSMRLQTLLPQGLPEFSHFLKTFSVHSVNLLKALFHSTNSAKNQTFSGLLKACFFHCCKNSLPVPQTMSLPVLAWLPSLFFCSF